MKRNINRLILLGVLLLSIPSIVLASSDAVVGGQPTIGVVGANVCEPGWTCRYYTGAVRFTYVDQEGHAISNSFDFVTKNNQASGWTFVYNALTGDKSKLTGSFSFETASYTNFPKMHEFISNYNKHIAELGHGTKSTLSTTTYTGGESRNGYEAERNWFKSLTTAGLSEEDYQANVEAFGLAIQDLYSEFNAEEMKIKIQDGCVKGEEIFLQMEPLYAIYSYGREVILGTIRDVLQYYWNGASSAFNSNQKSALLRYLNNKGFLYTIYYDRPINAPNWVGYEKVSYGEYSLTSASSMNDKVGYAVGLDWINDSRNGCTGCKFEDGKFYYDDEEITTYVDPFEDLYEYILSKTKPGGKNCCGSLTKAIEDGDTSVTDEQKEYHEYYCDSGEGEPCTIKEFPEIGKDPKYYCPDGKECSEDEYKEQCDVPDCERDPNEPEDPGNNCCTDDPIEAGHIEGVVNNCCTDGTTSEAKEYDLDKLFCKNEYLGVDNFQYKCNADYYADSTADVDDQYCKMYCTERVSVEIPKPITAISGRYFKLTETSHGTKSSYIEGFKRCRLIINYDKWEQDYYDIVKAEEEAYNDFQKNKAYELMYDDAIKASTQETENVTVSQSCTSNKTSNLTIKQCSKTYKNENIDKNKCYNLTETVDANGTKITKNVTSCKSGDAKDTCYVTKKETTTSTSNSTCKIKYTKYPFKKMYDIYSVKIDEDKRDDCEDIYEAIEFKAGNKSKTSHDLDWAAWNIDDSDCSDAVNNKTGSKTTSTTNSTTTTSCTATRGNSVVESHKENVEENKKKYEEAAKAANEALKSNAQLAKQMEETIDKCDKYFTDYKGSKPEESYQFNATQKFSYTQVYMNELGRLQMDEIFVDFEETPGCVIDEAVVTNVNDDKDGLSENRYSDKKYGNGFESMTDFSDGDLAYQDTANGFKNFLDTKYDADKIFTTDAKYHVTCKWDEGENKLYTLVPSGTASESTSEINYTQHNQEYKVYLSTLDGTYETYWDINGLGTNGRFDKYFKEAGNTCSGQKPNESPAQETLSCKIHSEHEIVLTGYCNGTNGTDTTADPADCDPYEEGYRLFNFKVVDPANLFPSGVGAGDREVAKNWTVTEEGQKAMQEIEALGKADMTYAPENLTYSFVLTPTDMGHIKNYNAGQISAGGYSDFTLVCSSESCNAGACDKCKSPFLENLSNGIVKYDNTNHKVSGWGNKNKDLTAVRKGNGWN